MRRREFLKVPALAASLARTGKASVAPFPGAAYHAYAQCLPNFLRRLADEARGRRDSELAKLTGADAIAKRQYWVRETLWRLIGGEPEKSPLNARTIGSFERAGYRVERVVYESRPNCHISANLYVPQDARGKLPSVLFQMGHADQGKAYPPYQRFSQALARLGYLVLAFDPMGQGERVYYPNSTGQRTRLGSSDEEHTLPGKQMLLFGDSSTRFQLWDAIRSLDYLASHPLADPKRLASTGHSGGATLTMLLAAVDSRLACAAACMGNMENMAIAPFLPPGSTDDAEQNIVASGPAGFDRWDLLYPLAPKPLFLLPSDADFFSTYSPQYIANGWREFQQLREVYRKLGHADRLSWSDTPLPHELSQDVRLRVYNFFQRWMRDDALAIEHEPPTEPELESKLWVAKSGSMVKSFGSVTPFALIKARESRQEPADLFHLIGAERPPAGQRARTLAQARSYGVAVEAIEVRSAIGVFVPAWLIVPDRSASQRIIVVLDPAGRTQNWFTKEIGETVTETAPVLCLADIRGVGDMSPEYSPGAPGYAQFHQQEENYAWSSLIFGKPLLGQRVTDILALLAALRADPRFAGWQIVLAARGKLTVPALVAASMDDAVHSLYLDGGLTSVLSVARTEQYRHPLSNFVPGFLLHTDLPLLAAKLAPRRVCLAGPVDATGTAVPVEQARQLYSGTNVAIKPATDWSPDALMALA